MQRCAATTRTSPTTWSPVYENLLLGWGREMAPGTTVRQLAAVLTGLVEGMTMRQLVDPDLVPPSLFADAVLALVPAFTRPLPGPAEGSAASFFEDAVGAFGAAVDPGSADGELSEPSESSQSRSGRRRVERTRAAIIAAARAEFALVGFAGATVAGIAATADVSATTVYEHFGSKAGLAAASFERAHAEAVSALVADGQAPLARLHSHLCRVYALLVADRSGTKALLDAVIQLSDAGPPTDSSDPRALVPLPDVLVPVIAAAQAAGELRPDAEPWTIAGQLVGLLFLNVLMAPREPEDGCRHIEQMTFGGLYPQGDG